MPPAKPPKLTPSDQSARFIAMAKELGADESEERFNEGLKKVAKAKVADYAKPTKAEPKRRPS